MKVELNIEDNQLELLDKSLKDFLLNLSNKQKLELLKSYINTQLDSFRVRKGYDFYSGKDTYEYTEFGSAMMNGLKDQLTNAIEKSIMENEEINKLMSEEVDELKGKMSEIISNAITKYVVDNVFASRFSVEAIAQENARQVYRDIHNPNR